MTSPASCSCEPQRIVGGCAICNGASVVSDACKACSGDGWTVEAQCCGNTQFGACCGDAVPAQVQCETCGGSGKASAVNVLARAYSLLESEAELIYIRHTKNGSWPSQANLWQVRHAELIESASQLRALAQTRQFGEREG